MKQQRRKTFLLITSNNTLCHSDDLRFTHGFSSIFDIFSLQPEELFQSNLLTYCAYVRACVSVYNVCVSVQDCTPHQCTTKSYQIQGNLTTLFSLSCYCFDFFESSMFSSSPPQYIFVCVCVSTCLLMSLVCYVDERYAYTCIHNYISMHAYLILCRYTLGVNRFNKQRKR